MREVLLLYSGCKYQVMDSYDIQAIVFVYFALLLRKRVGSQKNKSHHQKSL